MNAANAVRGELLEQGRASLEQAIESTVLAHAGLVEDAEDDGSNALRLVGASSAALRLCENLQKEAVQQARRSGRSWAELGALLGISRQAAQQRFAPASASGEWYAQNWHAEYRGHDITVRNSWNKGLKLFVDGTLVAENNALFAVDASKPLISMAIEHLGEEPFRIEVMARALINVRVKIVVNGEQVGGDQF